MSHPDSIVNLMLNLKRIRRDGSCRPDDRTIRCSTGCRGYFEGPHVGATIMKFEPSAETCRLVTAVARWPSASTRPSNSGCAPVRAHSLNSSSPASSR